MVVAILVCGGRGLGFEGFEIGLYLGFQVWGKMATKVLRGRVWLLGLGLRVFKVSNGVGG